MEDKTLKVKLGETVLWQKKSVSTKEFWLGLTNDSKEYIITKGGKNCHVALPG